MTLEVDQHCRPALVRQGAARDGDRVGLSAFIGRAGVQG